MEKTIFDVSIGSPEPTVFGGTRCVHCGREFTERMVHGSPMFQYDLLDGTGCCSENCKNSELAKRASEATEKHKEVVRHSLVDLLRSSNIPEGFLNASFDNLKAKIAFVENSVYITGKDSGVGKTHLAVALLRKHIENGRHGRFETAGMLIEALFQTRNKNDEESWRMKDYVSIGVLVVDDLGTEARNETNTSALFTLLNERMNKMRPTIVTTNLTPFELTNVYGDRLTSRITCGNFFSMTGKDQRGFR